MEKYLIRKSLPSDSPMLAKLILELQKFEHTYDAEKNIEDSVGQKYIESIANDIRNKQGIIYIAEVDKQLVGLVIGWVDNEVIHNNSHFYVSDLIVNEKFRGKGIGKALLEKIEIYARSLSIKRMSIGAIKNNENALNLYRKRGFKDSTILLVKDI